MKTWKQDIANELIKAHMGKIDLSATILEDVAILVEDDTGDVNNLEFILATLLLAAHHPYYAPQK